MKRILIIVTAAALVAPALGQAARANHLGQLVGVPGSQVKFKESSGGEGRAVTSFAVRNFDLACDGGTIAELRVAKLSGTIEVSDRGAFRAKDDNGETVFKVKGQIKRNKSVGVFRYYGDVVVDGVKRACDTGKRTWVTRP